MLDPNFYITTPRLVLSYLFPENEGTMEFLEELYNHRFNPTETREKTRKRIYDGNANLEKNGYGRYRVSLKPEGTDPNAKFTPDQIESFTALGIVTMQYKRQPYGPNAPDLGFSFLSVHQGKGYASEAALAIMEYYRKEKGHTAFFGFTDAENASAIKVFKRLGFEDRGMRVVKGITYGDDDINASVWSKGATGELEDYGI